MAGGFLIKLRYQGAAMAALEVVKIDMKQMTAIPQETSQTCWFTCYQMMLQWKGYGTGQIGDYKGDFPPAPIKEKLVAAGVNWDDACATGLKGKDFRKSASALGLEANGVGQQWTTQDLKRFLSYPSPIWVAGNWDNFFHVVVVTKVEIDNDLDWDEVGTIKDRSKVTYIDPNWKGSKQASIETKSCYQWLPGSYAYKGIIGAWQVWKKT